MSSEKKKKKKKIGRALNWGGLAFLDLVFSCYFLSTSIFLLQPKLGFTCILFSSTFHNQLRSLGLFPLLSPYWCCSKGLGEEKEARSVQSFGQLTSEKHLWQTPLCFSGHRADSFSSGFSAPWLVFIVLAGWKGETENARSRQALCIQQNTAPSQTSGQIIFHHYSGKLS